MVRTGRWSLVRRTTSRWALLDVLLTRRVGNAAHGSSAWSTSMLNVLVVDASRSTAVLRPERACSEDRPQVGNGRDLEQTRGLRGRHLSARGGRRRRLRCSKGGPALVRHQDQRLCSIQVRLRREGELQVTRAPVSLLTNIAAVRGQRHDLGPGEPGAARVTAGGAVHLGGTLIIRRPREFRPTPDQVFTLVEGASVQGTFAVVDACDAVELTYGGSTVTLRFLALEGGGPDIDGSGGVDGADLGIVLAQWGPCSECCAADLDGSGAVDGADLGLLLAGGYKYVSFGTK